MAAATSIEALVLAHHKMEIAMTTGDDYDPFDLDLDLNQDLDQDVVAVIDGMARNIDYDEFEKSGFSIHYFVCAKNPSRSVELINALETKALADPRCEAAQFLKVLDLHHKEYVRFMKDVCEGGWRPRQR